MSQAKYPAFISLALFKSVQKTLVGFSKAFGDKRLRKQFILLGLSIVNQGSTRLQEASQIVDGLANSVVANLSNFLSSCSWITGILETISRSFVILRLPKALYVILDLTALVKTGKQFTYLDKVHDGRDGLIKAGYNLSLVLGINQADSKEQFILHHQLLSSQHPSWPGENSAICSSIRKLAVFYEMASLSLKNIIHIGDRGYDRKSIINEFIKQESFFLIRAKNKNIALKNGTKTKLYQLKPGIYYKVYINSWDIHLNVVVTKAKEKEDDKKEKEIVPLTNLSIRKLSLAKTKLIYQQRWQIETCFKTLKNSYGLEDFRVRSWQAIQRIISFTLLTFNISQHHLRAWEERLQGLGKRTVKAFSSVYYLRKYIQKVLNFGFQPTFWPELASKQCNSP